ncbi:MAG: NAD(+) diphosphatase [Archangium sp.]|nr:NAD(+) diphosphatase [Archangium sp.]
MAFTPKVVVPVPLPASTRWFICRENEVLLKKGAPGVEQLPSGPSFDAVEPQMVGELDGVPCVSVRFPDHEPTPDGFEFVGLRALWSRLDEQLFAIAGRANQLAHFASTHRFCGRCGAAMQPDGVERAFRCSACGLVNYPRIAPAIITLVRKGDTALLANSGRFPIPFFSTLAGFSEVGESLEETLVREVFEETGVHAGSVRYFGSQPWPFPNSLMIAFTAQWERGDIVVDGKEIKEARFFRADELPRIPPKLSIARRLIDAWVREVTGQDAPGP